MAAGLQPESTVTDFCFHPANPQVLFMADQMSGVYFSADGGASWLPVTDGLSTRAVNALAVSVDGLHLYAATEGGGVFRLDLNGQPPSPAMESESGEDESQPADEQDSQSPEPDNTEESDEADGFQIPCLGGSAPFVMAVGLVVVSLTRRKSSLSMFK